MIVRVIWLSLATALLPCTSSAQDQSFDFQAVFNKARLQILATVKSAQRYTCTEAIERSWFVDPKFAEPGCAAEPEMGKRKLTHSDRLRLDVAVGAGQEIFAWHGAGRFQTEEIDELVAAGPIHSGTFFSFLSSIFLEGTAKIHSRHLETDGARKLAVFDYSLPAAKSRFETRSDDGNQVMGYHGRFTVDAASAMLVKLTVIAGEEEIPVFADICNLRIEAQYSSLAIRGTTFQLAANVEMDLIDKNRELRKTVTHYEACREFTAESTLRFDNSAARSEPNIAQPPKTLPAGLSLQIRITSPLNAAAGWAGDLVLGQLARDLRNAQGSLIARKGTQVSGRVLSLERYVLPTASSYFAALRFDAMTLAGETYRLDLSPLPAPQNDDPAGPIARMQVENWVGAGHSAGCRFRLENQYVSLKGAVTRWVTIDPPRQPVSQ